MLNKSLDNFERARISGMALYVIFQGRLLGKPLVAYVANVGFFTGVYPVMRNQILLVAESFAAVLANVGLLAGVYPHVHRHVRSVNGFSAHLALSQILSCVDFGMLHHVGLVQTFKLANVAAIDLSLVRVRVALSHVDLEVLQRMVARLADDAVVADAYPAADLIASDVVGAQVELQGPDVGESSTAHRADRTSIAM